jgi:caspase domain-containing protein
VLADPALGGFAPVETLRDAPSAEIRKRAVAFLRAAEPGDTVLIYYSGHGKLDDGFNLYLCSSDSEVALLEATAVRIGFVHDLLKKCRAEKTVMLLDCCYSGAAGGVRARGNVDDQLKLAVRGSGTYLLTASDAIETAQEKEGERYGVFTKHVIEGLSSGAADREGRGFVTMDDLYDYVVRAVRADSPQRPNREVGGHGDIVIARSGKDSRKDRARDAAKLLYARAAAGDLDATIAAAVEAVARKRPSAHSPAEAAIDAALSDLMAEQITLGAFVTAYWRAQALGSPPRPTPDPPPADPPKAEAAGPWTPAAGFATTSDPAPAKAAKRPAVRRSQPAPDRSGSSKDAQRPASAAPRIARFAGAAVLSALGVIFLLAGLIDGQPAAFLWAAVFLGAAYWMYSKR